MVGRFAIELCDALTQCATVVIGAEVAARADDLNLTSLAHAPNEDGAQ